MSKSAANQQLLLLLVGVYNQYIQYYYYFPDVVLCGNHRLEKMEFDFLLNEGLIMPFHTDSFGKLYRLSKKAENFLQDHLHKRRHRHYTPRFTALQTNLPF